jgi:hypothetical protein
VACLAAGIVNFASGAQFAEEIHRSGRPVRLAVGRPSRLPRH